MTSHNTRLLRNTDYFSHLNIIETFWNAVTTLMTSQFANLQLVGNFFGYLRDKNINVTNGEDFLMEDNFVDTLYGNPIWLVNLKQTKVRSNMFGFQVRGN